MQMNRREFLGAAVGTAVAGAADLAQPANAAPAAVNPFELVPLGKTGIKVSRIGCGTGMRGGMRQSNQTRMGLEKFSALLQGAYERGIRYFDLADLYGTHDEFAAAMKNIPRENYVISSKIWVRSGGIPEPVDQRPPADVTIDRFRKELNTDYIDLVLIHCMTDPNWTDQQKKTMDIMENLKARKIIRAHGVSIHCDKGDLRALEACATSPWVDSLHTRINAFGDSMDDKPERVAPILKKVHDAGKGVVGMKLVGEGRYRNDPQKKDQSIQYVLGLGSVDTMIVGFEKIEEIDDFSARLAKAMELKNQHA